MSKRQTKNISLTPYFERLVDKRVASGRYGSASEVVREGLRLLEERDRTREAAFKKVKRKVAVGLAQARGGKLLDGDAVFDELLRKLPRTKPVRRRGAA